MSVGLLVQLQAALLLLAEVIVLGLAVAPGATLEALLVESLLVVLRVAVLMGVRRLGNSKLYPSASSSTLQN